MQDKLRALVRLAEIDASARHLDEQLAGIPEELEERRLAVGSLEALVEGQRNQLEEAKRLLAAQEADLKARNDSLSRARGKSAKARNMREAQMAERELELVRRSIREGEEEKQRLEGLVNQISGILDAPLKELSDQKAALAEAEQSSEGRLSALRAERSELTKDRDQYATQIPKEIYRRYERIRPKLHPTVVEAADGVCQGCRLAIAPQLYNQIIRCDDFYQCQACTRFLYYPQSLL
ncbi:MAG: zinc ribbon domain-containing protein [Sandaracinaceae bacterium]